MSAGMVDFLRPPLIESDGHEGKYLGVQNLQNHDLRMEKSENWADSPLI